MLFPDTLQNWSIWAMTLFVGKVLTIWSSFFDLSITNNMLIYDYFTDYLPSSMFCSCLTEVAIFHPHHSTAVTVTVRACWACWQEWSSSQPHLKFINSLHSSIARTAWIRADDQSPLLDQDYPVLEAISAAGWRSFCAACKKEGNL